MRTECTPEQGQQWQDNYTEGYRVGRGDVFWNMPPRIPLVTIPAERPGETGAEYVARHVADAWPIGYSRAFQFENAR